MWFLWIQCGIFIDVVLDCIWFVVAVVVNCMLVCQKRLILILILILDERVLFVPKSKQDKDFSHCTTIYTAKNHHTRCLHPEYLYSICSVSEEPRCDTRPRAVI